MTRAGKRYDLAIVGAGFGGALLARLLAEQGRSVLLVERDRHPRNRIGESTTPLANLCLERIGRRYGLGDLVDLSAYGRWKRSQPELRCGLKRGFSFLKHQLNTPYQVAGDNHNLMMVAASPDDDCADTQWWRADVDYEFVRRAVASGVEYRDRCQVVDLLVNDDRVELVAQVDGQSTSWSAGFLVDASGGNFARQWLSVGEGKLETNTGLLAGHVRGVDNSHFAWPERTPYAPLSAAVHHLVADGWLYQLQFDNQNATDEQLASVGWVVRGGLPLEKLESGERVGLWRELLSDYPSLQRALGCTKFIGPMVYKQRLQRRLATAYGDHWVALPSAYATIDPLFSTGIAWTLRGVERLAEVLAAQKVATERVAKYGQDVAQECDQIDRLIAGAYQVINDVGRFFDYCALYFSLVSFAELQERLVLQDRATPGFLGSANPNCVELIDCARNGDWEQAGFRPWLKRSLKPWNLLGLVEQERHNLYPVDLAVLRDRIALLGIEPSEFDRLLPLLRGTA